MLAKGNKFLLGPAMSYLTRTLGVKSECDAISTRFVIATKLKVNSSDRNLAFQSTYFPTNPITPITPSQSVSSDPQPLLIYVRRYLLSITTPTFPPKDFDIRPSFKNYFLLMHSYAIDTDRQLKGLTSEENAFHLRACAHAHTYIHMRTHAHKHTYTCVHAHTNTLSYI